MNNGALEFGAAVAVFILGLAFDANAAWVLGAVVLVGVGSYRLSKAGGMAALRGEPRDTKAPRAQNAAEIEEKKQHVGRIMVLLHEKGELTNDSVQQLLGVSDATAERYLQELEAWGHVVQVGEQGRGVVYKRPELQP